MAAEHLISIIDDDPSMREAIAGLVRSLGYEVQAFGSAEEFLASSELGRVSCAISDIQMPGMNGFELQRQLSLRHGDVPVIIITALTEPDLEDRAMSNGAASFLRKPFEAETFLGCLERALEGA